MGSGPNGITFSTKNRLQAIPGTVLFIQKAPYSCVPVPALSGRLWVEAHPEAHLGIAQPLGYTGVVLFDASKFWFVDFKQLSIFEFR